MASRFQVPELPAMTQRYKACLIVLAKPVPVDEEVECQGRIILGGRLSLPLAITRSTDSASALQQAMDRAKRVIDRLESG